jgi:uncharacterized SAM-binding protein YcdF (DUF218 family)
LSRRNSTFLSELGPGGLSTLTLASLAALLGLGLPIAWRLREVLRAAAGEAPARADAILVLGRELAADLPTPVFRARLERGAELWRAGWAPLVVVSGGMTGRATRSEAAAGREHLLELGVPASAIRIEDRSRFTLENLFNVRGALRAESLGRVLLVSDPLHLARAAALARGLALEVCSSAARAAPPLPGGAAWWLRATREAFLLHWYHVGVAFSRAIGSERMLARVR